jgi:hypothetical protein
MCRESWLIKQSIQLIPLEGKHALQVLHLRILTQCGYLDCGKGQPLLI